MDNRYDQDRQRDQSEKSPSNGQQNRNPGNFKNDPERAREAGRKGGQSSGSRSSE